MDPSSSSLVPFSSSKRKRDPSSYDEHHRCKRPKNDVFVNYSFEDTGKKFVSHLKTSLKRNFFTISDHNTLPMGLDVSSEQLKAIEDSHIYVVVFSTNYSLSIKSLDELVLIIDSLSKFKNRKFFPVFLNVDPSDVRNLRGCFEEGFRTHKANVDPERVRKWKQAVEAAGQRSGLPLKNGDEADFVQKIVQHLKKIQIPVELFDAEHPVGIEPRAEAIISELKLGDQYFSNIVAVLGISGSGKTTIVKAVYDRIVADFDYNCFIENIHFYKNNGPNWKVELQQDVLRGLNGNDRFHNVGAAQIKKFIDSHKALLVLDDVDKFEELQALGIPSASLGSGSRIIVTTRNKRSLGNLPYTPYDIELLNREESFKLFIGYAYEEDGLVDEKFVKEIMWHAGGLPLVLEVWGLYFKYHEREQWPNLLKKLKKIPHEDVQEKLRVSYDLLSETSKSLFLDIVCFFDGWEWDSTLPMNALDRNCSVIRVLHDEDSHFFPEIEIRPLVDRGLVKLELEYNHDDVDEVDIHVSRVVIHHVIREMGQEVVRQENEKAPGQRTRLVDPRDVLHVLETNSGTNSVESIRFDARNLPEKRSIQVDAFKKMNNLRFIKLNVVENCFYSSSNDDTSLSFKDLKYLEWDHFPWRRINLDMGNVVVIKLHFSKLEILWEGFKNLKKVRILDVSYSRSLTRTGSFIGLENLEKLTLNYCKNLKEVDSSIVCLEKLLLLELRWCAKLKSIPNLPPSIEVIDGYLCKSLLNLPSNMWELQSLTILVLSECEKLGSESLMKLTGLKNLQRLQMENCNLSQVTSDIGNLVSLHGLYLSENKFSSLPDSFSNLSQLVHLQINYCDELQYLPLLPSNLKEVEALECCSLEVMPFDSMRTANIFRSKLFSESVFTTPLQIGLSVNEVPHWCSATCKETGNVFSFVAPIHLDKKICGVILCTIVDECLCYLIWPTICNKTKETSHGINNHFYEITLRRSNESSSMIVMFYPLNDTTLVVEAGDTVEVIFEEHEDYGRSRVFESCGLRLIYEDDVKDSALVIQHRNVTHEHTFPVPSVMNAAASITQLTDEVRSFSVLDNGCVYYDFFS